MNMKKYFEQGMMNLLEKKNIDSITVVEIIDEVGSCKGTFYKHYIDKYYLCCNCLEHNVYGAVSVQASSWKEFIMQCLGAFEKHAKVVLHAFDSKDVNSVRRQHEKLTFEFLAKKYVTNGGDPSSAINMITLKLYSEAVTEIIYKWLEGGCRESGEELYGLICAVIPQTVFKELREQIA